MAGLTHKLVAGLKRVNEQEEGNESLQTVLIMALATVVLAFAYKMLAGEGGSGGGLLDQIGGMVGEAVTSFGDTVTGWL